LVLFYFKLILHFKALTLTIIHLLICILEVSNSYFSFPWNVDKYLLNEKMPITFSTLYFDEPLLWKKIVKFFFHYVLKNVSNILIHFYIFSDHFNSNCQFFPEDFIWSSSCFLCSIYSLLKITLTLYFLNSLKKRWA
jgi:hypothetical protein